MEATQETKRRRRGEIREDGMVFWCYSNHYKGGERWVAPEKYAQMKLADLRYAKNSRTKHAERVCERVKRKYWEDPEKARAANKKYTENRKNRDPEKFRAYYRNYWRQRKQRDPKAKMISRLRARTFLAFAKNGYQKAETTISLVGTDQSTLRKHIERLFLPGMTWRNMTQDGWHIDHIIPLACAKSLKHLEALCHYLNLRPLWAKDNLAKGDKIPETVPDNIKHLLPENWNE